MNEKTTVKLEGSSMEPIKISVTHTHGLGVFEIVLLILFAVSYSCGPTVNIIVEGLMR